MKAYSSAQRGALLAVLGLNIALLYRTVGDLDIGTHLACGRWILQNGTVPTTDPFTYTIRDHEYVAYHWFFQVLLYGAERAMGVLGLELVRTVMILGTWFALFATARLRRIDPIAFSSVALLASITAEDRYAVRPELFTFACLATELYLLQRMREGLRTPWWSVPAVFLLWVNTHIYAIGLLPLGLYVAERWLIDRRIAPSLQKVLAATLAALFLNPYHVQGVLYPFTGLLSRMGGENAFAQNIAELVSPFVFDPTMIRLQRAFYIVLLVLCGLAILQRLLGRGALRNPQGRPQALNDIALMFVFGAMSTLALRNLPLLGFGALVPIAQALRDFLARWPRRRIHEIVWAAAVGAASLALSCSILLGTYYLDSRRSIAPRLDYEWIGLGIRAADFIERQQFLGRGFNNLNIGAVLTWRAPSHPVFIDGRNEVSGETFFMHHRELSTPRGFEAHVGQYDFQYVALAHGRARQLSIHLMSSPSWRTVYLDGHSVVLVRKDGRNAHVPDYRPPAPIKTDVSRRALLETVPFQADRPRWLSWFYNPDAHLGDHFDMGSLLLHAGPARSGERMLIESLLRHPHIYEPWALLNAAYRQWSDPQAADLCALRMRQINPERAGAGRKPPEANPGAK